MCWAWVFFFLVTRDSATSSTIGWWVKCTTVARAWSGSSPPRWASGLCFALSLSCTVIMPVMRHGHASWSCVMDMHKNDCSGAASTPDAGTLGHCQLRLVLRITQLLRSAVGHELCCLQKRRRREQVLQCGASTGPSKPPPSAGCHRASTTSSVSAEGPVRTTFSSRWLWMRPLCVSSS